MSWHDLKACPDTCGSLNVILQKAPAQKWQTVWPAVLAYITDNTSLVPYLDLAGVETGAGLEFSRTECDPPVVRTERIVNVIEVHMKMIAE